MRIRISIKLKFSLFLAAILLLTVIVLSMLVLQGIERNQRVQVEGLLSQQADTANVYFIQSINEQSNKVPQTFLKNKGEAFAKQLELISGQPVVLFDGSGAVMGRKAAAPPSSSIKQTLAYALENKTAYLVEGESLYYLTPLRAGGEQVGVVQFYYSLHDHQVFYDEIKRLFISIGAGVFVLSFLLAYLFFNSFARSIIKLNVTVSRIREGQFAVPDMKRWDELGELGAGIAAMSERLMATMRDKDEEREKLALAVRKLSELDRQQKEFIGNVTHEFKTPLTSIKAYLDLLDMYPGDEELLTTAKTHIAGETQRLYEMVEKVLQLSALEKYDFEYNKESLEIRSTIETVLDFLKGKMEKFGLTLETDLHEAYMEADKDYMNIVLGNLLDNAIKYNRTDGRIRVSNVVRGNEIVIEIADTGIGIPAEVAGKIFEAFYTVDRNRSREHGGAGLGLSIAKRYAESQGGRISIVKSDGNGTTFQLTFPTQSR
ncbi:cell wall metabolism sensor histidine kinase WalK [Paenibacillus sp. CF384]|uniref:sensor histidine kinase n=1 Tax=Paenibacillus sp. CF384 TaxID=1884382 RepID=UPI0008981AB5|nr:HAMP domain-containing sensor histidine kinase [Paenibacillus sp. CF384]SDX55338.1 Signal transduction histidine kinase [Paenibacillus sp. CF384]